MSRGADGGGPRPLRGLVAAGRWGCLPRLSGPWRPR